MCVRAVSDRFCQPLESRRLLASTYYVSPTGDDTSDGRSPATAWQTIGRANGKNWNPGDRLLFEGGQTFAANGTAGSNVLANPSFDNGLVGWTDTYGTVPESSSVTNTDRFGTGALVISGAAAGARAQDVTASVAGNQTYRMSAWTKVENQGSGIRRIGITFTRGGENIATFYRGFRNVDWAETDWAFVAPPVFDQAVVWISRSGDNSTVYADDITLSSLPNAIIFDASDSGTVENPVIVGSYGAGKATIAAGDGIGLWGGNVAGMRVMNLNVAGSWNSRTASGGNAGVGIEFVNTRNDNSKLEFITVEKCDVNGFQWAGIRVGGWAGKSGFRTVLITDSIARGNGDVGIYIRGEFDVNSALYSHEKVYVARCKAYANSGIQNRGSNSGSGILMSDVLFGTVERCVAYLNGAMSNFTSGGPIGIWAFDASKITLQYSESYSNKAGSGSRDGAGFDLDSGVTQSVMQNNYSHDNDGAGYLAGQFANARPWGRNIIRNNISQNDSRKGSYGGITLSGPPGAYNLVVEHNTIYMSPSTAGGTVSGVRVKYSGTGVSIRNNIIQTTGGVAVAEIDNSGTYAQFNGNAYWSTGSPLKFRWKGVSYATLEAWRAACGRETIGATPTGLNVDPQLVSPGTAGSLNDGYKLTTLSGYQLRSTSRLINAGVTVKLTFKSYTPPPVDFFGRAVTSSPYDVGAAEWV
jgi:hypothetical protein